MDADEFLDFLVGRLHSTPEPHPDLISEVGCGDLENLIREDGERLWPRIEKLARDDIRFRRALQSVWAYDSPEYERRVALLEELGETRSVRVSFIVEPEDFAAVPRVEWRAFQVEGEPQGRQLGRLLREIADWYERQPARDNPEVVRSREVWEPYRAWSMAAGAVERLWHEVAVAPNREALMAVAGRADELKRREGEAWSTLIGAIGEL